MSESREFRLGVEADAAAYLINMVGKQRGKEAAARVSMAFAAAARSAKDPEALYRCSRASIVSCIASSALSGLMPGGAHPKVWLVPKAGELQWWMSHRGIAVLALRAGFQIIAVPVHNDDDLTVEFGEVTAHEGDPDRYPESLDEIRGVYLTIRRLSDGVVLGHPWMPVGAIHKRRKAASTQSVWRSWPIEQAQKTAIKWAMARGFLPIESEALDLAFEAEPVFVETTGTSLEPSDDSRPTGSGALGLDERSEPARLQDRQAERDAEDAETEASLRELDRREKAMRKTRHDSNDSNDSNDHEAPL